MNKALLSVKKMVAAGNRVVFDPEGSYIDDRQSGERMWMTEEDGMYMLTMWVKRENRALFRGRAQSGSSPGARKSDACGA